jgi:transcriptional regulator with XRE-family HTH domain
MGQTHRRKPKRLASKLLAIRNRLGATQTEMAKLLKLKVAYTVVSGYERGKQEPDLIVLLRYARLVGASVESLIDDKLNLPK